jgi:hypothetical protein
MVFCSCLAPSMELDDVTKICIVIYCIARLIVNLIAEYKNHKFNSLLSPIMKLATQRVNDMLSLHSFEGDVVSLIQSSTPPQAPECPVTPSTAASSGSKQDVKPASVSISSSKEPIINPNPNAFADLPSVKTFR